MALGDDLSLLFRIKADGTQAEAELKKVRSTVSAELREIDKAAQVASGNIGGLSGAVSALLNPTALLTGAGIAAGAALIGMAKSAFDAAGELYDLSQKTNFSVETLSALKNAAETSGGSIQGISTALTIFQKNQEAANTGNKKLSDTFQRLKIDTHDNEAGLREAFKALSDMKDGEEQTALAMELFGRSGKDVLGVIKETNGDLDAAIAKYREMGSLISTETAKAADELGDALTQAGQSAKGLAGDLITELAPALWGIAKAVNLIITAMRGWMLTMQGVSGMMAPIAAMIDRFQGVTNAAPFVGLAKSVIESTQASMPQDIAGGANVTASSDVIRAINAAGRGAGGGRGRIGRTKKKEGPEDFGLAFLKELSSQAESAQKSLQNLTGVTNVQRAALELLDDKYKGISDKLRDQILRQAALTDRWKEAGEAERNLQKATTDLTTFITRQNEAVDRLTHGEKSNFDATVEAIDAAIKHGVSLQGVNVQLLRMNSLLLDAAGHQKILSDLLKQGVGNVFGEGGGWAGFGKAMGATNATAPGAGPFGGDPYMGLGPPPDFKPHMDAIGALKGFATDAWGGISSGFGNMIEAFLVGGNQAGISFGKMAKAAIASVTAQAAVHAIFELGMYLASLWLNPAEAATHLLAAETFGLVAGVGAAAALAIPGGSGGASAAQVPSTGARSGGGSTSPQPIVAGRTTANGPQVIELHIKSNDSHIVETVVRNYNDNGKVRTVIKGDGMVTA